MATKHYQLVDVFTNTRFGGNQLAVFTDGTGLSTEVMQRIARELNLSETTFVLPPQDPTCDCQVRIFTPARELPMAGHPTVGTAYVLARRAESAVQSGQVRYRFEEGVGPIPVTVNMNAGTPDMIFMQQPAPKFGPVVEDRAGVAAILSLDERDLAPDLPIEVVSTGVPFLYVPLKDMEVIQRASPRLDLWEQVTNGIGVPEVFVFTLDTLRQGSTVHSRMFVPQFGIMEDPATGAASGPLGCYLVKYGLVTDNPAVIVSEQGFEMGRPSFIHIEIERTGDAYTRVLVGGQCVHIGGGYFEL